MKNISKTQENHNRVDETTIPILTSRWSHLTTISKKTMSEEQMCVLTYVWTQYISTNDLAKNMYFQRHNVSTIVVFTVN